MHGRDRKVMLHQPLHVVPETVNFSKWLESQDCMESVTETGIGVAKDRSASKVPASLKEVDKTATHMKVEPKWPWVVIVPNAAKVRLIPQVKEATECLMDDAVSTECFGNNDGGGREGEPKLCVASLKVASYSLKCNWEDLKGREEGNG